MVEKTREDARVQEAIRNLFFGSMPERESEISGLLCELELVFQMLPDVNRDGHIIMDGGLYRFVRFNHRVVRSYWIGAYAAWEGYKAIAESTNIVEVDLRRFQELIAAFEATIENQQADEQPLPHGVPEPGSLPDKGKDPQRRAAAELAIIALGWAFLHEIRHVRHQREGTSAGASGTPECKWQEEYSCDEFATKFILEKIPSYADESGDNKSLVRRKRELAIYFALFALTLLAKDKWGESDSHPAVQSRINAVCEIMGHDRDETAEAIGCAAFATLRTLWPSAPTVFPARIA